MKHVKLLLPLMLLAVLFWLPAQASADSEVQLYLNEKKLVPEVAPRIVNGGTTIVPVRIISEELGAKVTWYEGERIVKIVQGASTIELKIDRPVAIVNGINMTLEAAPTIIDGNTLVPVRFVAEQLGLKIGWDGLTRSVFLFKQAQDAASSDKPKESTTPGAGGGMTGTPSEASGDGTANGPANGSSGAPGGQGSGPSSNVPDNHNPSGGSSGSNGSVSGGNANIPGGSANEEAGKGAPAAGSGTGGPSSTGGDSFKPAAPIFPADPQVRLLTKLELSGDKAVIQTNGEVAPKTFVLNDPYRIVVDLPHTALGTFAKPSNPGQGGELAVQHPLIQKIRYAQYSSEPYVVRIVFDLKQRADFQWTENKQLNQWLLSVTTEKFRVVIDAGHGGSDPGASSVNSRFEKDFTLAMANKVYELLQKEQAIQTYMTRTDDSYPTLQERVDLANNVNAHLFVSIHGNKYTSSTSGTETYYSRPDSAEFASRIHRKVVEAAGLPDRQVRQQDFKVIRDTTMPAVLLEIGYLSNRRDEALMYSDEFQSKVAAAIVAAIKEQLQIR